MLSVDNSSDRELLSPIWARKLLFAALYFSEGGPIGFIWLTIPVQLRLAGVPAERIAWLLSILILPWTLKFLWAPLVDTLRSERWTLRHWIYASQMLMAATLLPLIWLDPVEDLPLLAAVLLAHGVAAATQDVSIDALCMATTTPAERGAYNGWMQVGVLLGRATMGGGMLAVFSLLGNVGAVCLLIATVLFSMALLFVTRLPTTAHSRKPPSFATLSTTYRRAFTERSTWWGVAFALVAGAAFKSFEAMYGPYLVDLGFSEQVIGVFTAGPMIGALVLGSMLGGWLTDRVGCHRFVRISLVAIVVLIASLASLEIASDRVPHAVTLGLMMSIGMGIGVFTAASYAMYMNLTRPAIAATQFSTFMGAINGCESWSVKLLGRLLAVWGYGPAFLVMCALSLVALPMLRQISRESGDDVPLQADVEM
jgi:MFS family permease